ncbi:phage tail terminator family protein [Paenibacillus sp. SAFN-117]|uniref:phage tail terminator family protein n=1 Tax=Paenibacillus sp. SAFN-117 TaxID=3436860 RepID=UPI003F7CF081
MSVTLDDVRNAVASAIRRRFPDAAVWLEEEVIGEPERPCFIVKLSSVRQVKKAEHRYLRTHSFTIEYWSGSIAGLHEVAEALYDHLETIEIAGDLCRGRHWSHEIKNGILQFIVEYPMQLIRARPSSPKMKTMYQEGDLKHG